MGEETICNINLAGLWEFAMPAAKNSDEPNDFRTMIRLPGSMDEAGLGNPVTEQTAWHLNRLVEYTGAAFYRRRVVIPDAWADRPLELFLERCHWASALWVDGSYIGSCDSLCTPHRYRLDHQLTAGEHTLLLRVDNSIRYDVGNLSHAITDHTQTNWNGIIGRIELWALPLIRIRHVEVYPDAETGCVSFQVETQRVSPAADRMRVTAVIHDTHGAAVAACASANFDPGGNPCNIELACKLTDAKLWDEFSPALYSAHIRLERADGDCEAADTLTVTFGLRDFRGGKNGFLLNNRPVFLRGTLDCCVFPLTGYPAMTPGDWRERLSTAKAYGFNHIRFHSWCPPEAAFDAGDRLGMLFQVEAPVWTCLGEKPEVDHFVTQESLRILKEYGNHPCFCMLAAGNEPSGKKKEAFLDGLLALWKKTDARRLYTGSSGWPELGSNDYHVLKNRPAALRCQDWADELNGRLNSRPYETESDYRALIADSDVPIISHEVGQWCAFPDFSEINQYTGVLRASNLEIFQNLLTEKGLDRYARQFLYASGRLQLAEYKEDIEAALRTPGFGGFQLLGLTDFPGQGTALVGILNAFGKSKGYTTDEEFRQFCSETVPLARLKKAVYVQGETLEAEIGAAHYGATKLEHAVVLWSLETPDEKKVAHGSLPPQTIPFGSGLRLGSISIPLCDMQAPTMLKLRVGIAGTRYTNSWDIWLMEDSPAIRTDGLVLSHSLEETEEALQSGKRVLYLPPAEAFAHNGMPSGFTTVFWNYEFTAHQAPRTLGILCDPAHPSLARFPTQAYSGWQWFDLLCHAKYMVLDKASAAIHPLIRVIDDWNTSNSLGVLLEANVGAGKLLLCSMNLTDDLGNRPAAAQMLASLTAYMRGQAFRPDQTLTFADIRDILDAQEDRKTKLFDYRDVVHVD